MNRVIDKGLRSCRFVSTIVKHPVYTILNLECCKGVRMRFHWANGLVVLLICAVAHLRGNNGSGYDSRTAHKNWKSGISWKISRAHELFRRSL